MVHTSRPKMKLFAIIAALGLIAASCSVSETEPDPTTTLAPPPPSTTVAPLPTTPPTTVAAVQLSPCEEYFVALDVLLAEFIELIDDGNRALLLTIGQETPYEDGAVQLAGVANRLLEINQEVQDLGDAPTALMTRVGLLFLAVNEFAVGYGAAADAAALADIVSLNQSLATVSRGTPLLQAASQTLANC